MVVLQSDEKLINWKPKSKWKSYVSENEVDSGNKK